MKKILLASILLSGFAFADGATTYAKCVGCHGTNGKKHALGNKTLLQGLSAEETKKTLLGYKEGSINKFGMGGVMKSQLINLSDKEINEVSLYIANLSSN